MSRINCGKGLKISGKAVYMRMLYKSVRRDVDIFGECFSKTMLWLDSFTILYSFCPCAHTKTMNFSKGKWSSVDWQEKKRSNAAVIATHAWFGFALNNDRNSNQAFHYGDVADNENEKQLVDGICRVSYIREVKERQFSWVDHAHMSYRFIRNGSNRLINLG